MRSCVFLRLVSVALVSGSGLGGPARAALDPTHDKILYAVADAHLDTEWNWTIQDTINSYIPATLHTNFVFFGKYPHYTFSFEGAFRYDLAKEYYPADFATLSNYVALGRWHVAGSAWDAGDVNIPSPESLIRHVLYANEFWKKEFGQTSVDLFLPDCFGFGYALPSVGAHCGLKGFSSCRVSSDLVIPQPFQNIGRWIGPDGSSLVAVVSPGWYSSSISSNLAYSTYYYNRITNMFAASGLYLDYLYFGTGDQGGGPSDASVNWLEQSIATTNGLIHVVGAGSDQLFRDLTPAQIARLPSYQGELLGTLGTGSYTTHPEMKQYNRENEQRGDAAERASVIADWLQGGGTYPQQRLTRTWQRFLWCQFHDVISGTAIPAAYTFAWNDELLALSEFGAVERHGAGVLAEAMDTTAQGVPLVVYNPLSIAREDIVEANVTFSNLPTAVRVFGPDGNEVPSQYGVPTGNTVPVTFLADVPAVGAAVYDVRPSAAPCELNTGLSVSDSQLENARYRVQLNGNGDVVSILDKLNNRQLLSNPIRWDFLNDTGGSAWQISYNSVAAPPVSYLSGPASFQVLENGPARVTLGVIRHNDGSTFTERIRLAAGGAGDQLDWDLSVNWKSPQTLLKVEFPLAVTNPFATYDLGLGTIQRTNDTSSLYEVPAQQWADLTSTDGSYGVTIMDDSKIGWDKPNDRTLRLTLFHDPLMGSSYPYQGTNGFGTHRLAFAVMGHTNDWRAGGACWAAARLNQPLQAFQTLPHAGILGKNFGFLSCNNSNVMVKALKKAENSNEIVVRLQELAGKPQTARLSFTTPILAARQVTGAEDPITNLSLSGGVLDVSLGAYAPMTLALTLAAPGSLVAKPVSVPVALPFNLDAISTDASRTDGNFDNGYSYPAELMPNSIVRDGITFQLGPTNDGAMNALSCTGQVIALNGSGYNRLYLLAAAASTNTTAAFTVNGVTTNLTVHNFTGFIGQWSPPSQTSDEVGLLCTHRHDSNGLNDAYDFCYLFKYRLDLPPNATSVTLPNAPNIRIFAMSLAADSTAETVTAGGPLGRDQLPWANAGPNQTVNAATTNGTAAVALDGSGSAVPGGTIVSYVWSKDGTPLATGVNPVVNLAIGTNTISLTVTDNQGQTAMDEATVVVLPPLTVAASATPTNSPTAPLSVQFTGQASGGAVADSTDDHLGAVTAQGENNGVNGNWEVASNAFDDVTGTKWLDFATNYPATRQTWIQYQYANGARYTVVAYTVTSANDAATYPGRNPANWHLLGSNDGGSSWTTLDVQTNQVFTGNFQKLAYAIPNTNAYNLYRFQIDRIADPSAGCMQLDELEFLAFPPPYTYRWSFGDGTTSTAQNPTHTYTNAGDYLVVLGVTCGPYSGTNATLITIGPPLTATLAATPAIGSTPLTVQFTGQAVGGNGARTPYDTTDDQRGIITAQGNNPPNETCVQAFDDTTATKWLDFANAYPATRSSWIQYQYAGGLQCVVSQYTVASANDATIYPGRNPANWRLLGSNDGGASWTTLDIQTNQIFTANFQTLTYIFANTNAYNLYRFQIGSISNPATATCVQLSELQFIGKPAYSYSWSFGDGTTSTAQNPEHTYASNGTYTVTLTVSDGAATATASKTVQAMPLVLAATPAAAGSFAMSWPTWASDVHLYATTNLTSPVAWSPVTNAIFTNGVNCSVTLPVGAGERFFQLRSP